MPRRRGALLLDVANRSIFGEELIRFLLESEDSLEMTTPWLSSLLTAGDPSDSSPLI